MSESRTRIAEAAMALFRQHGVTGVTMRRIADIVGVSATAIYRHYANRDAILNEIADAGFDEIARRMSQPFPTDDCDERILIAVDRYVRFALEDPAWFELMFTQNREGARVFPRDFAKGASATGNAFIPQVARAIEVGGWRRADLWAVVLTIWAHSQGLIALYNSARIEGGQEKFLRLARDSMSRVIAGLKGSDVPETAQRETESS